MGKTPLKDELRKRMPRGRQAEVAVHVGVSEGNLRSSLSRNRYDREALTRLLQYVDMPTDLEQLQKKYDFSVATERRGIAPLPLPDGDMVSVRASLFRRVDRMSRAFGELERDVAALFAAMGRNDAVILATTDEIPVEWTVVGGRELLAPTLRLLEAGAFVGYIIPDAKVFEEISASAIPVVNDSTWKIKFEDFVRALTERAAAHLRSVIRERVVLVRSAIPLYIAPGHRFVMFQSARSRPLVLARYPVHKPARGGSLFLPLDDQNAGTFAEYVNAAFRKAAKDGSAGARAILSALMEHEPSAPAR